VTEHRSSFSLQGREGDMDRLFQEFSRTRDPETRDRLVHLHESLARFLAAKFANRGEPLDDLVQVAMVGLIHAVDRFEPGRGTRFSTFATPTIVGEIKRYFRDRAWNLKVPRWLQELNQQVVRANEQLSLELGRSPGVVEIATHVGCTEEQALDAMELGNAFGRISLEGTVAVDADATPLNLADALGEEDPDLARIESRDEVEAALRKLDNRERAIIYLRFFQELSQIEVARRLHISQMHVSRLQQRALRRLRTILAEDRGFPRMEAA
jgi:RNA polymerase sigma-B factor